MPFPLAIRSQHQLSDAFYPRVLAAGAPLAVALTEADGAVRDLTARTLTVRTQREGHVRDGVALRRGGIDVLVTDDRVVLAGARPTPDSILAGHVRLEWIVAVGGCTERGLFRGDALRLVLQLDNGDYRVLTLTFDGDVDVHEVAQDIARRTARRWLATGSGATSAAWSALAEAPALAADRGEFALHWMPTHTQVADPVPVPEQLGVSA